MSDSGFRSSLFLPTSRAACRTEARRRRRRTTRQLRVPDSFAFSSGSFSYRQHLSALSKKLKMVGLVVQIRVRDPIQKLTDARMRAPLKLICRSGSHYAAAIENNDSVGNEEGAGELVGYDDDGDAER